MTSNLRSIPSVDKLLSDPRITEAAKSYSRDALVDLIRNHLQEVRQEIGNGFKAPKSAEIVTAIVAKAKEMWRPWPQHVINATGVIVHTNLGRAPLSADAMEAMIQAAKGYTDLEMDIREGKRGSRHTHVARLLRQITGAEVAIVVNNNASAVLLGLAALAQGKEVIVSRGEAVEIGGGFRIPDVMRQSGTTLVEVGTTNRTYLKDYEKAITERTAALLKVHSSNFRITGFTHVAEISELVDLGKKHNIPILHDLGSGCMLETTQFGLAHEPMPQESIAAGAGLAFFSGDKLLGGPQCGIVVGKKELVETLTKHPLARAIRIDKLSLAALSATLLHYIKGEATQKIPVWRMMATSEEQLKRRATRWQKHIGSKAGIARAESTIGGGSLPGETLPTWVLALDGKAHREGAKGLAALLRLGDNPVIGRIEAEQVLLDPRTVLNGEDDMLLATVKAALG